MSDVQVYKGMDLEYFRKTLEEKKESLEKLIPNKRSMPIDRYVRILVQAAIRNPEILKCDPTTIWLAFSLCAQYGLEPDTPNGHAYLIPRWNKHLGRKECTVIIGYKGLMELAYRCNAIKAIRANIVYKKELEAGLFEFSYEPPKIVHKINPMLKRYNEDIIGAYCVVEFKRGGKMMRAQKFVDIEEIKDKHMARSASKGRGPWITDFAPMCRKTPIRVLLSQGEVPISSQLASALEYETKLELESLGLGDGKDPLLEATEDETLKELETAPSVPKVAGAVPFGSELPTSPVQQEEVQVEGAKEPGEPLETEGELSQDMGERQESASSEEETLDW